MLAEIISDKLVDSIYIIEIFAHSIEHHITK